MPSRWALLRMAAIGRCSFTLMTPVGVFCLASDFSSLISFVSQGSPERRLYLGFAFRGPFLPIGEPGRFQLLAILQLLDQLLQLFELDDLRRDLVFQLGDEPTNLMKNRLNFFFS